MAKIEGVIRKCYGQEGCWAGVLEAKGVGQVRFAGNKIGGLNDKVTFEGDWITDPKWGKQFRVKTCDAQLDQTAQGITGFLDQLPNVGPVRAATIYRKFKKQTFEIIETEPHRLSEAEGITPRMCIEIHEAYMGLKNKRDLVVFLKKFALTDGKINKIIKTYGHRTFDIIKNDPYQMIDDIDGFGFKIVDEIAISSGIPRDAPIRIQAGILHALSQAEDEGHCYLSESELITKTCRDVLQVPAESVRNQIKTLIESKSIIAVDGRLYTLGLYKAEQAVAEALQGCLTETETENAADDDGFEVEDIEDMSPHPINDPFTEAHI